jgi:hypothetical protein
MSVKIALVSVLALSLAACAEADVEDPELTDAIDAIEETLNEGGPVAVSLEPVRGVRLEDCGEELCVDGTPGGCCASERGTICFTCEVPPPPVELSECEEHTDCGPFLEGNRCAVDSNDHGSCYRVCGGPYGFTCDEGQICMTPYIASAPNPVGFCFSPPEDLELEIDWDVIAANAKVHPSRGERLKGDLAKFAVPE